ncbi:prepilin-type N-terminal cleavage/methylation domain-containing protein [bacterium]|nr:MAG: prepilin-type N-terminal cleavage/methylation domain-containing protein [bacterium]
MVKSVFGAWALSVFSVWHRPAIPIQFSCFAVKRSRRAFTLTELLAVMAILAVLSGVLYPVFASSREAAKKASCLTRFRQASRGMMLYGGDYDDMLVPVNHRLEGPANSTNDRTWVQLLLPYAKSFDNFTCPSDHTRDQLDATYDDDLVVGDMDSRYYTASQRSNLGYNFLNLAPIVRDRGVWTARPKASTIISQPSSTLLFVDSVWDRTESGQPIGGGSWLVVPPCRFVSSEAIAGGLPPGNPGSSPVMDAFTGLTGMAAEVFTVGPGWATDVASSRLRYGGAWPWHRGRLTVAMLDGSVRSELPAHLGQGCDVAPNWSGLVKDLNAYVWDAR